MKEVSGGWPSPESPPTLSPRHKRPPLLWFPQRQNKSLDLVTPSLPCYRSVFLLISILLLFKLQTCPSPLCCLSSSLMSSRHFSSIFYLFWFDFVAPWRSTFSLSWAVAARTRRNASQNARVLVSLWTLSLLPHFMDKKLKLYKIFNFINTKNIFNFWWKSPNFETNKTCFIKQKSIFLSFC